MDDAPKDTEHEKWLSTYGIITAERILGSYHMKLSHDELVKALNDPGSFYHRLLQIPLKNVLNGIILQQAYDYHVYAQKLFIDYILSGESGREETSPGAATRETLEEERVQCVALGESFHQLQREQHHLIATSQAALIQAVSESKGFIPDFDLRFGDFLRQTHEMTEKARSYRTQFYNVILRVIDLVKAVPEYKTDIKQDQINREGLYFDQL